MIEVLSDVVLPANPRKRVEVADLLSAYVAACRSRGVDVVDGDSCLCALGHCQVTNAGAS